MRALHVFSNWKWTGPAELALNACRGLNAIGVEARFACGRAGPERMGTVREHAIEQGLEPVLPILTLSKHFRLFANLSDARRLRAYVAAEAIDIVHAHLPNDHAIAARALGRRAGVRLVRTSYDGERLPRTLRMRLALRATDALIVVSRAAFLDARAGLGFPEDRIFFVEAPIDTHRFDPARRLADLRPRLGLAEGDFAFGIVARMQRHRRFDVFLEAVRRAAARAPHLKAVVIGRGTHQEAVAREPARSLGISDRVLFPGYLEGEDYVAALAAIDAKVFLVPGSDGSCRAVREAMSMGKPVIAARRGMLPEIVSDGRTGLLVDDEPEPLAGAMLRLALDRSLSRAMGEAARNEARERFSIERAAKALEGVYEATLARPRALSGRAS